MSCDQKKLDKCIACEKASKSGSKKPPSPHQKCKELPQAKMNRYNRRIRKKNEKLYREPSRLAYTNAKNEVKERFRIMPDTNIYDGNGNRRGRIDQNQNSVKINYGQIKMIIIDGIPVKCVYVLAIAYNIDGDMTTKYRGSGWIKADAMNFDSANPDAAAQKKAFMKMPTRKPPPTPNTNFVVGNFQTCKITGGKITAGGEDSLAKKYGDSKVNPCTKPEGSEKAMDYCRRPRDTNSPNGYVNLLFNTPRLPNTAGGFSTDTLPVHIEPEKDANGTVVTNEDGTVKNPGRESLFYRYKRNDIKPVTIPLFVPCSTKRYKNPKSMTFVYGFVGDPADTNKKYRRYGWIAEDALECL